MYANVSGRDVGAVAADIQKKLSAWGKPISSGTSAAASWSVPDPEKPGLALSGYAVRMRGEVTSMQKSFASLGFGLLLAAVLIYLIMVAQFRSFLDPFIIMFAVPLGLIGVLATLYLTGTTVNVQSFMRCDLHGGHCRLELDPAGGVRQPSAERTRPRSP